MPKMRRVAPKLVNRGPAGLLNKLRGGNANGELSLEKFDGPIDRIAEDLLSLATPISVLNFDPDNARLHPERNLNAIKKSLSQYGQQTVLVVQKWADSVKIRTEETQTNRVVVGNGRLEAAKQLGWTVMAASFVDMTDAEAAGYGLADNRSAELAKWDFDVVTRLERLISESGGDVVGWSEKELIIMRGNISPEDFPEVDEQIEVEHICPKCGYSFSGGKTGKKASNADGAQDQPEQ